MNQTESSIFDRAASVLNAPHANAMLDDGGASDVINFSYEAIRYPLGFPLRILSNSQAVLRAADQSWMCFHRVFDHEPLELRVAVKTGSRLGSPVPPAPIHSQQDHLIVEFADTDNYFVADLAKGHAICWVTESTVRSPLYLRYHMLEAAALCMITTLRAVAVHAACVIARDKGILLCGDSGAGKSTLAFAGARSGWTYVTDDACYAVLDRDAIVAGNCHQVRFRPSAAELFPEINGHAITPRAAGKPSIEARTSQWPAIRTASTAKIERIVVLNRNDDTDQKLVSLSSSKVLPWFIQYVMATSASRAIQEAALSRLLRSGAFELRYHDLDWAIERINLLAEDVRC